MAKMAKTAKMTKNARTANKQSKSGRASAATKARETENATYHGDALVVGTKVKDLVRSSGCMSSAELLEALSARVHTMLLGAVARAKGNNRSTVRPYDL